MNGKKLNFRGGGSSIINNIMISRYTFENNANDVVGSNNGIDFNMAYITDGVGKSGSFNGVDSYIQKDNSITYNSFSISFLFKSSTTSNLVIYSEKFGASIIEIAFNQSKIFTRIRSENSTGITTLYTTTSVNDNNLHHLVMTFDILTGIQTNYLDGVFDDSVVYTGGTFNFNGGTSAIGVYTGNFTYGKFNGLLDEVIIWNKTLLQNEISYIASNQLNGIYINNF